MRNIFSWFSSQSHVIPQQWYVWVQQIHQQRTLLHSVPLLDFPQKTEQLKQRIRSGESLDVLLPEAFALVAEAFSRTMDIELHDVQYIGAMAIHVGAIAEMKTGEGKTFTAVLPAYLNALEGKGVHVVSPNDYLAKRDAGWVGEIYAVLGLQVSAIIDGMQSFIYDASTQDTEQGGIIDEARDEEGSFRVFDSFLRPCARAEAYQADITYGTNNQFGFDYLRDNTQSSPQGLVQRTEFPHHFAIVDEVDSILIDEARVPLILSAQAQENKQQYIQFARIAGQLHRDEHYLIDEKLKAVSLTDAGIEKTEQLLGISQLYGPEGMHFIHLLETSLRAQSLYLRDRDYVVRDGKVVIVDPFTGRMQEGRRWSEGLHQSIEAKENVAILDETRTIASITYQNYFKFYKKLAGMTGTAITSSEEFFKVYGLDVYEIPTHKPIARTDLPDLIFQTEKGKFKALARNVKERHQKGQPILIGTVSIEKNELLSAYLHAEGIPHVVLNAKNHQAEGEIIAQAGRKNAVTIATNMAGRGVDIKLGGNPATPEEIAEIKNLGGLCVLGTERHDARRIDNQLRGRSGRQGDPGETQFYVSLEDPLMKIFGAESIKGLIGALGIAEDEPIQNNMITSALEKAQQKIEGFNFDARKHVLSYDDVLSTQRNAVYARRRSLLLSDTEALEKLYQELVSIDTQIENLRSRAQSDEAFLDLLRRVAQQSIDRMWMDHLHVMDQARQSVNLRAYGQREPLVEYRKEGLQLYRAFEEGYRQEIVRTLHHIHDQAQHSEEISSEMVMHIQPENIHTESAVRDYVMVRKGNEVKEVKRKKINQYIDTGWEIVNE